MAPRNYNVISVKVPIVFNSDGDHDHNGMIFALKKNKQTLDSIRNNFHAHAKTPHELVRPLVLRARLGETVTVYFTNHIEGRHVGIHLIADGYNVNTSDGAKVGNNPSTLAAPNQTVMYQWDCQQEGVFPFHDAGNLSGGEDGTNVHGLFGALVVEPQNADWTDPKTGNPLDDGLYADVHPKGKPAAQNTANKPTPLDKPDQYPPLDASFREYVVFFHDEPEFVPPHGPLEPPPCPEEMRGHGGGSGRCCDYGCHCNQCSICGRCHESERGHCRCHSDSGRECHRRRAGVEVEDRLGQHRHHGGSEHEGELPIMPISYRAEPMINRERKLWRMMRQGLIKPTRPVIGEEQHHSSWLFGDPDTPVLKAYVGDPIRIRLVHAAVKETHVFHQHVYQWHAEPRNENSPIIDSITISPQTAHTIELLYGAGSSQGAIGDAIFHCHLYPHFHEGMWGMLRTFDLTQDGSQDYPDGTTIENLEPLPDRQPLPNPTNNQPGWPQFMMSQNPGDGAGVFGQKSPIPPWPARFGQMPSDLDYRPATTLEETQIALHPDPKPGALFNRREFPGPLNADPATRGIAVTLAPMIYNDDGWHDPYGHLFILDDDATSEEGGFLEPLVVRGHDESVVETTLENRLPATIPGTAFDLPFPPCDFFPTPLAECGLHVHLVKFDPLVSDGASVGWNYITGPQVGKKMIYRWHVDEEFGTVFFHDHLFANYRQKHGLFGAFIAEPKGAWFLDPLTSNPIATGLEAVVRPGQGPGTTQFTPFREFCFAVADFVPQFDGRGDPLNPPEHQGGHGDQGVMAVNYRSEPIPERGGDPAFWFLSRRHEYEVSDPVWVQPRRGRVEHGDPSTHVFQAHAGDPLRIRLFQGSHEEQHSFQVHGMRWRQYLLDSKPDAQRPDPGRPRSPWRNQQTIGISEAFSFVPDRRYGPGDHLWKFGAADDLWLGCWGLIRVHPRGTDSLPRLPLSLHETITSFTASVLPIPSPPSQRRRFRVVAERRPIVYRKPDLIDPFGIVYRLEAFAGPGDGWTQVPPPAPYTLIEPLILRCRRGDWVQIELRNDLPLGLRPEPFAPEVPVEACDRPVSSHVSMHADLLRYDVRKNDGANVGRNPIQTAEPAPVGPGGAWPGGNPADRTVQYLWYADRNVGPVLLQDMADFRNHRHHGLVGALIVEWQGNDVNNWYGPRATLTPAGGGQATEEAVLILQDGLRLFFHGNPNFPIPDELNMADDPGGDRPDAEDQGQKGFNYRSEPTGEPWWLDIPNPATPVFEIPTGSNIQFHLIGGADKPRNYSFTIHDHAWVAKQMSEAGRRVGSVSGVTTGWVETFEFCAANVPADYAYRTGMLKWSLSQGLWGIVRLV